MIFLRSASRACAVATAIAASALLSGCMNTVSGTAVRAQHAAPVDVQPLTEAKLADVLLSIGELNGIMGSTQMRVTSELQDMTDHSAEVSDPDCLGAIYGAEEPVYAGSGWTAMRDQVAREPGEDNEHWVEQTVVLYPTAEKAQKFFDESTSTWQNCAGYSVSVDDLSAAYLWQIDEVTSEDSLITQMTAQEEANGWACQHALSVVSNVTVEAWACGYSVKDEAATIANDMVAKAARK
ncbi:sensor domain-containing protein [Mycobacterium sp. ACS1612]|uniref:sensor domain-containing protein n=1 Tax=Mycobacterium sp. ACS1612 TaxID=1834117 RepID=UPI000AF08727|nr:sensor domain-containing protein [Mycobacterium sp. ACS1612]